MEMVKAKVIVLLLCFASFTVHAQEYEWTSVKMDGSRTGCTALSKNNMQEALGQFLENGDYVAPNGKVYAAASSVAKMAALVRDVQPQMSRVKTVIATSEEEMYLAKRKESKISNWFVGVVMDKVASLSGKKVDVGICNFGGIRMNMPKGDVILDDILSMFPFKNNVVYLELKGSELRKIFEKMAATRFEAIGGVEIVAENGKLTKALIGGQQIDDDRLYGVATISFLLNGGDSLTLAENAVNMEIYDVQIIDAVLEHISQLNEQGKSIKAPSVTYVTIK